MARIHTATPTKGQVPSHGPPDMQYAPGLRTARSLGWFSVGLGIVEVLRPDVIREFTGIRDDCLVQACGFREIVTGIGILTCSRPTVWLWGRVAGDVLDMAALGNAAANNGPACRAKALVATAAVAGVTAVDVACASRMQAAAALEG